MTGPVVVIVTTLVTAEEPAMLTDEGENVQSIPRTPVQQDRLMVPVNPFRGVRVMVEVPDCPGAGMVMLVGFADILKSVTLIVVGAEVVEPA